MSTNRAEETTPAETPSAATAVTSLSQPTRATAGDQPISGTLGVVHESARVALQDLKAVSQESARGGSDIWAKARDIDSTLSVRESTYVQYLSKLARDDRSFISCAGRKQGYFLAEEADKLVAEASHYVREVDGEEETKRKEKEKLLYPVLVQWARSRGYSSADLSRGKAMGKWGNPDVVGVEITEHLGAFSIELLTIEAKVSFKDWQQLIFECVSHRRFANRAYFAFAHPKDLIEKSFDEMLYYAELFGVGLLVLGLDNSVFKQLTEGTLHRSLTVEEVDIRELFSSPHHHVPLKHQKTFCHRALGCIDLKSLVQWGEQPEGQA